MTKDQQKRQYCIREGRRVSKYQLRDPPLRRPYVCGRHAAAEHRLRQPDGLACRTTNSVQWTDGKQCRCGRLTVICRRAVRVVHMPLLLLLRVS